VTTVATVPASSTAPRGRVVAAFKRVARGVATRAATVTRRADGTKLGAAGLASIAVGAGAQWGWPVGLMIGGALAVWFASLLPAGGRK
jgi:hypothetical protein